MDVREINNISTQKLSLPNNTSKTDGFKQIFDQKLSAVSATKLQAPPDLETELLEQSDKVLDLLDEYIKELNDPAKTLKDIDFLVQTIEKEVNLIAAKTSDNISKDKEIEGFVNDLAITANVALLKFRRGDYI